jgi:putative membrane protein
MLQDISRVPFSWSDWDWHPSTVIGVAAAAALYAWFARSLGPRRTASPSPTSRQVACYVTSLVVLLVALNGPIHDLSDNYLFSAHMVQHLLLVLVVAPLFLLGIPGWYVDIVTAPAAVDWAARWLTKPLVAFGLSNAILAVWHFPGPYGLAMRDHNVHIVMHLMMLVTAGMVWWPVVGPGTKYPRLNEPLQLLYLFGQGLPMSFIGAIISMADHPLYEWYVRAPRVFALSPIDDQGLGGLIMWVPGMLFFWGCMTVVWFRWSAKADREETLPVSA